VHNLPGDAAVALHPAGNLLPGHPQRSRETRGLRQHTSVFRFAKQSFANQTSQPRETKNRAYGLPREDHYTPDNVPNGVRWKNLLRRHLPSTAAHRNLASGISFLDCRITGAGEGI
jgi:hypothetical protein